MPFVDLPQARLHYLEEGNGLPLVWLPGGNDSAALMLHAHRRLADRLRLICVDPRGQGRSESFATPEAYAPAQHVADLSGFVEAVGLARVVIGGHSRGGRTGIEFALTHPQRVIGAVAAASPLLGSTPERAARFRRLQRILATRGVDAFLASLGTGPRHPQRRALWQQAAHHAGAAALIAQYEALARLTPLTERLRELRVPALYLCGSEDPMLGHSEDAARATPDGRLRVIPHARHALFADNPTDYFAELTAFLDGVRAGT